MQLTCLLLFSFFFLVLFLFFYLVVSLSNTVFYFIQGDYDIHTIIYWLSMLQIAYIFQYEQDKMPDI